MADIPAGVPRRKRSTPYAEYERAVATYTAAGGQETLQRVVTAISRLSRRLDVYYRDRYDALGISLGEWSVLATLAIEGRDGCSTPSKLADVAGVSPSTMTHRIDRMVERGFVTRTPDPDNRTRMLISLADGGWEIFRRAILEAEIVESDILAPLEPAERRTLATLLEKALGGLSQH